MGPALPSEQKMAREQLTAISAHMQVLRAEVLAWRAPGSGPCLPCSMNCSSHVPAAATASVAASALARLLHPGAEEEGQGTRPRPTKGSRNPVGVMSLSKIPVTLYSSREHVAARSARFAAAPVPAAARACCPRLAADLTAAAWTSSTSRNRLFTCSPVQLLVSGAVLG